MLKRFFHVDVRELLPTALAALVTIVLCVSLLGPIPTLADDNSSFVNPLGNTDLASFLLKILNALIYILFPIIILMMVYTGFLFVAAQGNPTKIQEARRALVWTVIGALIVLGSKALAMAIKATVDSLKS